ncbi:MAG: 50S ribosomal protein L31 [Enterobacteriaceae bacterium]
MKKNIHPKLFKIKVSCSCGNLFYVYSTLNDSLNIEVCNLCHPFYSGKKKILDSGGRISKFNKKFNIK